MGLALLRRGGEGKGGKGGAVGEGDRGEGREGEGRGEGRDHNHTFWLRHRGEGLRDRDGRGKKIEGRRERGGREEIWGVLPPALGGGHGHESRQRIDGHFRASRID